MKKIFLIFIILFTYINVADAVLKEKDLDNTLSILRTELTNYRRNLSSITASSKKRSEMVMKQLMTVYNKSNQNALMLYSQKQDYVFDLTYACHEATEQYQNFQDEQIPFKSFLSMLDLEIGRYDSLITSLKSMPVMTLSDRAKINRNVCLTLATNIRNTLQLNYSNLQDYIRIYDMTEDHLRGINDYANKRYNDIQTSIFKNGDNNYFYILKRFGTYLSQTKQTVAQKYQINPKSQSQWDSKFIIGLFILILFYGCLASLVNYFINKYFIPKRFRTEDFKKKRTCITMASSTVTFAIILGIIRATTEQNFVIMASDLLVEYAWLLGVILISLLLRLDAMQIKSAFRIYSPLIAIGFVVITFRIILIPNELVNLIFPPILLLCTLWQWNVITRHNQNIPKVDIIYTYISLSVFCCSLFFSWIGYTLFSVQMLIWWVMQLTCILTIACVSRWLNIYEKKKHFEDKPITQTWFHNLICNVSLPIMSVFSIMISIYWAADVFNLSDLCWNIYNYNFVDQSNFKLSLTRIVTVISMWFLFSYLCTTIKAFMKQHFVNSNPETADSRNMLGKNVVQLLVWGTWFMSSLSILGISFTWLMVVSGGLSTGIGFASKDILENIYYGVSLMTGRIKVGDLIECDGIRGKVTSISYTSTLIESTDGSVIAFQNSQLFTKNYKNLTRNHGYELSVIVFGIGYGSNVKTVSTMIEDAVRELHHPMIDPEKTIKVVFMEFGDNSVNLKLLCWVDVLKQVYVESDIKECIYSTLNKNDIEIPFPQRDIYIKNIAEMK